MTQHRHVEPAERVGAHTVGQHAVAGVGLVDDGDVRVVLGLQPFCDMVRPAIVGISGGTIAVGDGIAEEHDGPRIGLRGRQDAAEQQAGLDGAVRLEVRGHRHVAGARDIAGLHAVPVHRTDAGPLGEIEAHRHAGQRLHRQVHRVADQRRARRNDRLASPARTSGLSAWRDLSRCRRRTAPRWLIRWSAAWRRTRWRSPRAPCRRPR